MGSKAGKMQLRGHIACPVGSSTLSISRERRKFEGPLPSIKLKREMTEPGYVDCQSFRQLPKLLLHMQALSLEPRT